MRNTSHRFVVLTSALCRLGIAALVLAGFLIGSHVRAGELVIWDDQPARKWDTSYPVGNGRLGAMPQGMFPEEKILINEETIWARNAGYGMPENSLEHLEGVRKLEAAGDFSGADRHFEKQLENGRSPCSYQLLGWLHLVYQNTAALKQVHRELNLASGVATNVYSLDDGTEITQKVFASAPDDVIVVRISEIVGLQGDLIVLKDIFAFDRHGLDQQGRVVGNFHATGYTPHFLKALKAAGEEVPASIFIPEEGPK